MLFAGSFDKSVKCFDTKLDSSFINNENEMFMKKYAFFDDLVVTDFYVKYKINFFCAKRGLNLFTYS
jgi:hypothetical protein